MTEHHTERVDRGELVPVDPDRARLLADTEALDARHGGRAVLRGGLGDAELHAAGGDEDDVPVPVDPPEVPKTLYGTVLAVRDADKRPIIPAWARNQAEAQALAGWLARYGLHVLGYHAVRLPLYAWRLLRRAPVGVLVVVIALWSWVVDREATPLRRAAVDRGAADEYLKLSKQRNARVRGRGMAVLGGAVVLVVLVHAWEVARWWGVADG